MTKINWKQIFLFTMLNCLIIFGVVIMGFKKPQLAGLNKVEFINIKDSFINLRINVTVKNLNFFSVSGKNLDLKLAESGLLLGEGNIAPFCLKKGSQSDLDITMKFNFRQVIKLCNLNTSDSIEPDVSIAGSFRPFLFTSKINLKKKISKKEIYDLLRSKVGGDNAIRADSFSIKKLSALESQIDFNILFTNNMNFDFSISEVSAQVYSSKEMHSSLGTAFLRRNILLPTKVKMSVPFSLVANNISILRALIKSGMKDLRSFFVSGEAKININGELITIPFKIPFG